MSKTLGKRKAPEVADDDNDDDESHVLQQRKLLAELRQLGLNGINRTTRLSNGMYAQEFAMAYTINHRRKRQADMRNSKAKRRAREQAPSESQEPREGK